MRVKTKSKVYFSKNKDFVTVYDLMNIINTLLVDNRKNAIKVLDMPVSLKLIDNAEQIIEGNIIRCEIDKNTGNIILSGNVEKIQFLDE